MIQNSQLVTSRFCRAAESQTHSSDSVGIREISARADRFESMTNPRPFMPHTPGVVAGIGAQAEWHPAKRILMHKPNEFGEVTIAALTPQASLFETTLDPDGAMEEHEAFQQLLRGSGVDVETLGAALLSDAHGKKLQRLRALAHQSTTLDVSAIDQDQAAFLRQEQYAAIERMRPARLIEVIMSRPTIRVTPTDTNTGYTATRSVDPLMNAFFMRDQSVTTAKGVVLAKLNSDQRAAEVEIVAEVYRCLGIEPIYQVQGDGFLEGGDLIMAGDMALLGCGLRTNHQGVRQLLDNQVFGTPYVVVVKDKRRLQDEMHLDTYFNIAGNGVAVMVDHRVDASENAHHESSSFTACDVYRWSPLNAAYELDRADVDFVKMLREELGYHVIRVSKEDQLLYGCNFLTVGDRDIIGVKRDAGVSEEYQEALRAAGVNVAWVELSNVTKAYGAAHCTTQVFSREAPVKNYADAATQEPDAQLS